MKKKVIWLIVICLMVAALMPVSCGPAVEEVTFPDPNLKAAIREAIDKPEGDSSLFLVALLHFPPNNQPFIRIDSSLK